MPRDTLSRVGVARSPRSGRMGRSLGSQVRSGGGHGRCPGVPGSVLGSLWWRELRAEALLTGWPGRGPSTVVERGEKFCLWFFPYVTFLMRESCGRRACSWWRALGVSVLCAGSRPLPQCLWPRERLWAGPSSWPPEDTGRGRGRGAGPLEKGYPDQTGHLPHQPQAPQSLWPEHCPDGKGPCHTIGDGACGGGNFRRFPGASRGGGVCRAECRGPLVTSHVCVCSAPPAWASCR